MKAIFEVEFNPDDMCDPLTLKEFYSNSWLECMKYLFKEDGIGIFENDLKLIKVII